MAEAATQEIAKPGLGTFCWIELATSDGEAAKKFYTELFGWSFTDNPMGPGMVYTMLEQEGKQVAALYKMMPDMEAMGVPPNWLSYVSVTDADESAAKAKGLGGTLIKEPFDVMTFGRMAVIQDPTGAVFALWQSGTHHGVGLRDVPNSLCWNELATTDTSKAGDFYTGLFGWGKHEQQMGPMTYTSFMNGDCPAGGMYTPPPEMGDVPPHWEAYFAVADVDATANRAAELGAKICAPPMDIPGVGRMSAMMDPQGGAFAIIKLEMPSA